MAVDPRSGFCPSNSTFYSKRNPVELSAGPFFDVSSFILSRNHYQNIAFIDASTGRNFSYSELYRAVSSVASFLFSRLGVRKGHVILILSPNSIYFPIAALAVMSLGAIVTTANPLNTPQEIKKQLIDSNPTLCFTTRPLLLDKLESICQFPIVLLEGMLQCDQDKRVVTSIKEMMKTETNTKRVKVKISPDDTATLLYSSGTTGNSKAVVCTHRNLISMFKITLNNFKLDQDGTEPETFICTVPMFHVFGLSLFATGLLASGSTIIILSKFDMGEMLRAITAYKATSLPVVPPVLVAMANQSPPPQLGTLRTIRCGGAPLSKEVTELFLDKYPGVEILQGYGLTESTGAGTCMVSGEGNRKYGTAGMLSPNTEARIVDQETGMALPVNHNGELWIRGPYIMKGYFKNPEATRSTLDSEGWLRTGDLCYIDEDGYLFVVDRLKELIKYKGYQVAPAELEALLLTHPEITDAAVIPFPDMEVGQFPMAYVVKKAGSNLSEIAVMEFVGMQVAPYKRIRRVAFTANIPKNPSGKILRKDLMKLAMSTSKM